LGKRNCWEKNARRRVTSSGERKPANLHPDGSQRSQAHVFLLLLLHARHLLIHAAPLRLLLYTEEIRRETAAQASHKTNKSSHVPKILAATEKIYI
jgi:hypothetical protein